MFARCAAAAAKLDLRFKDVKDEAAFLRSCDDEGLRFLMTLSLAGFALLLVYQLDGIEQDVRQPLTPPLAVLVAANVAALVLCAVAVASIAYLIGCRRASRRSALAEHVVVSWFTCAFVLHAAGRRYSAIAWDAPCLDSECALEAARADADHTLFLACGLSLCCFVSRARVHRLVLPVATALAAYAASAAACGAPFADQVPRGFFMLGLVGFFSLRSAWRQERLAREAWRQKRASVRQEAQLSSAAALAGGMQRVADSLCDVVLHLDADLRIRNDAAAHVYFFGRRVQGDKLQGKVSEADRGRVRRVLERARKTLVPQVLPVTLLLGEGLPTEANLLAIYSGSIELPYVVGFTPEATEQKPRGEVLPPLPPLPAEPPPHDPPRGPGPRPDACATERWLLDGAALRLPTPAQMLGAGGAAVAATFHGQAVAVKVIRPAPAHGHDRANLEPLVNEVRVLRQAHHPNVAALFGMVLSRSSSDIGVVYELVPGQTLTALVRKGSPGARARFQVALGVCSALRYLHAHDPPIFHGDMKPDNVMVEVLSSGCRPKLVDFGGVACAASPGTGGTRRWAPPEALLHPEDPPAASTDIFSYGWVLWFTMTGLVPHGAAMSEDSLSTALRSMLRRRHVLRPQAPECTPWRQHVEKLSAACLRFDAAARPSGEEVHETLRGWLDGAPLQGLGLDVETALAPDMAWEDLLSCLPAGQDGAAARVDADVDVADEWRILSTQTHEALGLDAKYSRGESLLAWLEEPAGFQQQVGEMMGSLRSGAATPPVSLRFGAARLRSLHEDGPERSARLSVYLPDGSGLARVSLHMEPIGAAATE